MTLPAEGGARPEAMLLVSMPTGLSSKKLWYMVQALGQKGELYWCYWLYWAGKVLLVTLV